MVISDDCDHDTFILGMTWHRMYKVKTNLEDGTIEIPTKNGRRIFIQGSSMLKEPPKQASVY
jgi:hypothetical protein